MKKYPFLSMGATVLFFVLLTIFMTWTQPVKEIILVEEKKEIDEEKKEIDEKKKKPVIPGISVQKKKERFKTAVIPAVNSVYAELMERYQKVADAIAAGADLTEFSALAKECRAETTEELLMALKPHPRSIAIAQAAIESSWATSRFFKEANNTFGIWSFNQNEARIAAGEKRGDKTIWIKKYDSIEASVRDYYRTLARGNAYKEFRNLKMETNNPYELVKKLDYYSEKGIEYGRELAEIIQFNKFETYDQQQIAL